MSSNGNNTLVLSSAAVAACAAAEWYFGGSGATETGPRRDPSQSSTNRSSPRSTAPRRSLTRRKDCTVEICLSDVQSLRNALAGGCNSVELCVDRSSGGSKSTSAAMVLAQHLMLPIIHRCDSFHRSDRTGCHCDRRSGCGLTCSNTATRRRI
jgi:hypothetical protein